MKKISLLYMGTTIIASFLIMFVFILIKRNSAKKVQVEHQYDQSCLREGVYTVPEGVTKIADDCFKDIDEIKRIILPEGLQKIGWHAFSGSGLERINIPSTVTTIAEGVFIDCKSLKSIELPEGLQEIRGYAFLSSGLESINIPSTVTTIGAWAFRDCEFLKSIDLPEGLQEIGSGAFEDSGLESIKIPGSVKTIGGLAFIGCESLRNIIVADGDAYRIKAMLPDEQALVIEQRHYDRAMGLIMEKFTSTDNRAINGNEEIMCILNAAFEQTSLIPDVQRLVVDYLLSINNKVFKSMQAVAIPRSDNNDEWNKYTIALENILAQAKNVSSSSSSSSSSSAAPSTVFAVQTAVSTSSTDIEVKAEHQYDALYLNDGVYTVPEGVTKIADDCFKDRDEIKRIILPEGLQVIGKDAFRSSGLERIKIPSTVTTIGGYAFSYCKSLKSIELPEGLQVIDIYTFWSSSLESINLPSTVTTIGKNVFGNCRSLKSIELPEGLQKIGKYAFSDSGLESINIPSTVTTIGNSAFGYCNSLKSIELPEGLLKIGSRAFYESVLDSIKIPGSVKTIGTCAFSWCSSLRNIIVADGDAYRIKAMLPNRQKALVIEQRHYDRAMGLIMEKFTSIDNRAINGYEEIMLFLNAAFDKTSFIPDLQTLVVDYLLNINNKLFKSLQAVAIPRSDNNDEWNKYTIALENILAKARNASSSSSSSSSSSAAPSTAFAVQTAASTSSTNIGASVNNQNPPSIGK